MVCSQFIIYKLKKRNMYSLCQKGLLWMKYPLATLICLFQTNTKLLGLVITNSISSKDHITQLTPKLCKACYVLTCIRPFICQDTLKSVYCSYFHYPVSYGIIFWGNSSNSLHVFRLQKNHYWVKTKWFLYRNV
jgi:hypothetical protein